MKNIKKRSFFILLFILVYLLPLHIRDDIFEIILPKQLAYAAAISLPILMIFLILIYNQASKIIIYVSLFLFFILLITYSFSYKEFSLFKVFSKFSPLLLIGVFFKSKESLDKILIFYLNFSNVIAVILFLTWCIDYLIFTNKPVTNFISVHFLDGQIISSNITRFYSIYVHPLNTKSILLQIAVFNLIYSIYSRDKSLKYFVYFLIIGIFAVASTQSKTGVIIFLTSLLIYLLVYKKNIMVAIGSIGMLFLFYVMGIFNNLIFRFQYSDLTSGRNDVLKLAMKHGYYDPKFFHGYGEDFSSYYSYNVLGWDYSFEYFSIISIFDYGILFTLLTIFIMIIYPFYLCKKYKKIAIYLLLLGIFIDLNTYNVLIITDSEMMIMYSMFTMLVCNMVLKEKELNFINS